LVFDAGLLFGVSRLRLFGNKISTELKRIDEFDDRIAFESYEDSKEKILRFYPKKGGVEEFILSLESSLCESHIRKSTSITSLSFYEDGFLAELSSGEKIFSKKLIWTLPGGYLARLLNVDFESKYKPAFLKTRLVHLLIDRAPLTDLHYYYDYNTDTDIFRCTFYSNMANNSEYKITCEILYSESCHDTVMTVFNNLIFAGAIDRRSNILFSTEVDLGNSFPVMTNEFVNESKRILEFISGYKNIILAGKARGDIFFTNSALIQLYHDMENF
jgi:protoporphyrinogen oxidase